MTARKRSLARSTHLDISPMPLRRLIDGPMRIFDPCVGSGTYLVAAARRLRALGVECWQDCLVGADIDPLAVLATKLNLMLDHGEAPMKPLRIEVRNSLTGELGLDLQADGFDLVMTNPPWGARLSNNELRSALSPDFLRYARKKVFFFLYVCRLTTAAQWWNSLLPSSFIGTDNNPSRRSSESHA